MRDLSNYALHYLPRTNGGGGVAVYVNQPLQMKPRDDLLFFEEYVFESLFIEVMLHKKH